MKQTAVTFGPRDGLVGVLTEPEVEAREAPVMLLFNAGLLPRQGPHRMNVRIARVLAANGIASLRLDMSGLGDSQVVGNDLGIRDQAVRDLKSAMDWLEQSHGARRFLAFGVCSGAINAWDLAQADERVAGVMMFDNFWYRSRWTRLVSVYKLIRDKGPSGLVRAIGYRLRKTEPSAQSDGATLSALSEYHTLPTVASYAEVMQRLVDRGVDVHVVFGGSFLEYFSYEGQFRHVFGAYPFSSKVRCSFLPDVDHTFVRKQSQQRMLELIADWVLSHLSRNENGRG
jgi:dienelactone hydrolase